MLNQNRALAGPHTAAATSDNTEGIMVVARTAPSLSGSQRQQHPPTQDFSRSESTTKLLLKIGCDKPVASHSTRDGPAQLGGALEKWPEQASMFNPMAHLYGFVSVALADSVLNVFAKSTMPKRSRDAVAKSRLCLSCQILLSWALAVDQQS
jgi:hypothetical protein